MEIHPDRVALYIRWSTDDQAGGTTLDVQMEGCRHYVLSQGWHVRDDLIFIDDGYSGGSLDRPALTRLRRAVKERRVECVVCYKLDRLSRSVVDTVNLVLEEWDDLCHVQSAREPIDTASHAGKMFFYTLVSYAEWERSLIRERTASGRLRRAQEGRWAAGRPPYGYRLDEAHHLAPDPEEAPVVARIFREYTSGKGSNLIAGRLNAEGIPFRGKPWRAGAVKRVLENPVYIGELIYGATRANPRYKKRQGEPRNVRAAAPAVRLSGAVPPIIPPTDWSAAAARRAAGDPARARTGPRALSSPYLLSALAKCGRCGHSLIGLRRPGCREPVYFCRGRRDMGTAVCDSAMLPQSWLDAYVVAAARARFEGALSQERFIADLFGAVSAELGTVRQSQGAVNRTLARLNAESAHLRRLLRAAELSAADFQTLTAEIAIERREAEERLRAATEREQELRAQLGSRRQLERAAAELGSFDRLTAREQKTLLAYFVDSLQVYKAKSLSTVEVVIRWKGATPNPNDGPAESLTGVS